jgi:acetyl esterase/lipase
MLLGQVQPHRPPTSNAGCRSGRPAGLGLLFFPVGGYGGLAAHEGEGYARFLAEAGIAAFVVKYRLGSAGNRHPAMLEDALSAVAVVRSRASEFGVDPGKIGVMGSSAGGHLTAHTLVGWPHYASGVSLRPDFGILCYPVILSDGPYAHKGSMRNLAGEAISAGLLEALSCERHVTAQTPPCFLWHTGEDAAVPLENSLAFATALRAHQVPFELHVYNKGRHGLGLGRPSTGAVSACGGSRKQWRPAE